MQDVGRTHVNLGDHHENRHIECQCQTQVLLGHPHDAGIAAHLPQHRKRTVRAREVEVAAGGAQRLRRTPMYLRPPSEQDAAGKAAGQGQNGYNESWVGQRPL